ncbi:MAG: leucyl aminopeptidase, partial [Defluviitaleaceae bacterium]|nr:leucyl aminopeptidase [Defluviitaleaceae bacterium]
CLGKKETVTTRVVMRAIATAINTIKKIGGKSALVKTYEIESFRGGEGIKALMLGGLLTLDEPINFKSNTPKEAKGFSLFLDKENNAINEVTVLADHIKLARKLVNMPGNKLTPQTMSEEMQAYAKDLGLDVTVFDETQIQEMKMGALWAVGKGSINLPRLVVIRYMGNPQKADDITAVIGKGVTFDTGGYNLKPGPSMVNMKGDMGGAAATFATICALAKNKVKANVVAVLPLAENCIAGGSFKADDVIHSMSGKTIEVLNTDAEGRLIMCDALTYAIQKENAKRVVNIATLTGAMVAVLGYYTSGVLSNDEEFLGEFLQSSKKTSEQYWQLPRYDEYYTMLETPIADIKNVADGCGAIVAGLFMEFFAEGLPWIHIDIAGPAFLPTPKYEFYKKGGTGAGVEALYQLFVDLEDK